MMAVDADYPAFMRWLTAQLGDPPAAGALVVQAPGGGSS
ncbi:hypothetical protein DFR68_12018 [Nocardia mexicana]|uniref:Uncharacterized protein n=1 Tax=Nocardia mexicana TaxID=279262 RepID=A0A370GIQ7_9NOCA|nr:hypothetical protein DFR68_12018 [Nocardia mexicana]